MKHIGQLGAPGNDADGIMHFSVYDNFDREANQEAGYPLELLRVASVRAKSISFNKWRIDIGASSSCKSPLPKIMQIPGFHQLATHESLITSLCFSPKALFTASKDLSLTRFSMQDLNRDYVQPFAHDQKEEKIQAMCPFSQSSDGEDQLLATGSRDGTLNVWDVGSTNQMHCVETFASAHPKLNTMCTNSGMLFTGSSENTIFYWRIVKKNEEKK